MKANEMFEQLGYKKTNFGYDPLDIIEYVKETTISRQIVAFYLDWEVYDTSLNGYDPLDITLELHLAITQQMKELGWFSKYKKGE